MSDYINSLFNLKEGEENPARVQEDVVKNVNFRGANLWVLACAIVIASVGLNVNSTAVIIGAMLISPLMGPIVGAGFALGIYDFGLLKKSMRNLLLATVVSLTVSTLYFLISPFKDIQSELLSRTAPNIYDVIIAFFGGLVGVIAMTRVEKGNPIPGVAIATALMPPLCTAGYGLATGNISYFLGAFYLYCINCVFIGIATFMIIRFLKYPAKKQVDEKHQRLVERYVTLLTVIMLLPSAYLAYNLYREQTFKKVTDSFIEQEFLSKGYIVVFKKTAYNADPKRLDLAFLSHRFSPKEITELDRKLESRIGSPVALTIRQDSLDRVSVLKNNILNELNQEQQRRAETELQKKALSESPVAGGQVYSELKAIYPDVLSCAIGPVEETYATDSVRKKTVAIIRTVENIPDDRREMIRKFLQQRLRTPNVELINTPQNDER